MQNRFIHISRFLRLEAPGKSLELPVNPPLNYFTAFDYEVSKDRLGLDIIHIA